MNRETWLNDTADLMGPWFDEQGFPLPKIRLAQGFTSRGGRGKEAGECWDPSCSKDKTFEIFVDPRLDDPVEVAQVLCHELIHAAVGLKCGHRGAFRKVALALGLQGPMNATSAGPAFINRVRPILDYVGPLPHAALNPMMSSGPKKQRTRLLKAICPECGYTVRITRVWVENAGAPHCGTSEHGRLEVEWPEDEDASEGSEAA